MTTGALIDAIEDDKRDGRLAAVVTLWRSGYIPMKVEFDALAQLKLNPAYRTNPDTESTVRSKSEIVAFYHSLPKKRGNAEERLRTTADRHNVGVGLVRYLVRGGDQRVSKARKAALREMPEHANSGASPD